MAVRIELFTFDGKRVGEKYIGDGNLIMELLRSSPEGAAYGVITREQEPRTSLSFNMKQDRGLARVYDPRMYERRAYSPFLSPNDVVDNRGVKTGFDSLNGLANLIRQNFPELQPTLPESPFPRFKAEGSDIKPAPKVRERDTPKAGRRKTRRRYRRRYSDGVVRDERRARHQKVSASRRLGV